MMSYFLALMISMDAFSYSFPEQGKPSLIFDKDVNWLLNIGLEIKTKNIDFESDIDYKEMSFKIIESAYLREASNVNLVFLEGEEIVAIIKEFDLDSAISFSVRVKKDTLVGVVVIVSNENMLLDVGTYRIVIE